MNIIDALIVTLSLDPSGFKKGQEEAESITKKMRGDADRTAKEFEQRGKQMASALADVRNQVIGLFAAFTAGRGLKEFIEDITSSDAALGRTAKNIGVSADELSAWQGVAERAGGTASGITGSMESLARNFQQLALTGQSQVVPYFRALHVALADSSGKIRPMRDILFDLADHLSKLDPAKAQAIGAGLGLDRDTINVLIQGRGALADMLAEQEKLGHATRADAAAAQARQSAFRALGQTSEDLGRKLLTAATPTILAATKALTQLSEWAARHRDFVKALFIGLTAAVVTFAAVLASPLAGLAALTTAIAAAITAIALLYDDWKTWTQGGKSAFADFWQYFADKWATASRILQPAFEAWKQYLRDFFQTWKDVWALVAAIFTGSGEDISNAAKKLFGDLRALLKDFLGIVRNLGPALLDAFKSAFSGALEWVEGRFSAIRGAITGTFSRHSSANAPKTAPAGDTDIDKFVAMGWSRAQAAGIVANLQRESGGNAGATGDNGKAYGLAQWHPDRQAAFAKWAGHDIKDSTRDEQLAFVNYELREGGEKRVGAMLAKITDAASAGSLISRDYERPANADVEASLRGGAAAALAGNTTSTSTSTSSSITVGTVNFNGTQIQDGQDAAKAFTTAVSQFSYAGQANRGLDG